jgi:hypothetical protein
MDVVQQAARVLAEACGCYFINPDQVHYEQAQALADAGLLADTACRSCSGTGGTDLGGARCAVCQGTGHWRAET